MSRNTRRWPASSSMPAAMLAPRISVGTKPRRRLRKIVTRHSPGRLVQPSNNQSGIVAEGQLATVEHQVARLCLQLRAKAFVTLEDHFATGYRYAGAMTAQPVPYRTDRVFRIVVVCTNVLSGDIGAEISVT